MNTERFYKIEQILNNRKIVSFAALLEELEVSPATLKRDLTFLRDRLNSPIVYDREANGYRYEGEARSNLPGLWFSSSEAYALLMMQALLKDINPSSAIKTDALNDRLESLIGSQNATVSEVSNRIKVVQTTKRVAGQKYFDTLAAALLQRNRVVLQHWNRARNENSEREVSPQQMLFYKDNWYLVGYCHLRNELRTFGLDAIQGVVISEKDSLEMNPRLVEEFTNAGYGIFAGTETQTAKIKFNEKSARWVKNEVWHKDQTLETDDAGNLTMTVPYSNPTELVMEIMKYGSNVQVMEPAELKMQVIAEIKKMTEMYV